MVSRHHAESEFVFTAKENLNAAVRIYKELWGPRLKSLLVVIPPPTVGTAAQEIVKAAVDETKAIETLPLGYAWWAQCRRRALAGAGDVPAEEIDLALMILVNSRGKSFCTLCGVEADGNQICLSCYLMKPKANLSRCKCGEQRSKKRTTCSKCEVAIQMTKRRGYRVDLATRLEQNPIDALRCFACDGPRAVGSRLCKQCFLADDRVRQRERREDRICQDCGGPRTKHRQRCDDCFEAILKQVSPQDMRQEINPEIRQIDVGGKKRKRESGCPVPAQENAQENAEGNAEGKQCGNPNCGIILPPQGRLVNQRCAPCYAYTLDPSHPGVDRPRELCEKWKLRNRKDSAGRTCSNPACGVALPPGVTVIGGRCRKCYRYFLDHRSERPDHSSRTCVNAACGLTLPPGSRITLGRCRKCYRHFSVHKTERQPKDESDPVSNIDRDPKPSDLTCLNQACGVALPSGMRWKGRCLPCYVYFKKHGEDIAMISRRQRL